MSRPYFKQVAAAALGSVDLVLAQWLPDGKRQGSEYLAKNPRRADNHPGSFSVNLKTGAWADFATDDKGGDFVALVAYLDGCSQGKAAKQLIDFLGLSFSAEPNRAKPSPNKVKAKTDSCPIVPVPDNASPPPDVYPRYGKPAAVWVYRDPEGRPVLYQCRFDPKGQRKQIVPLTYWPDGWRWKTLPAPRPLYGLDGIAAKLGSSVLVCEGEKAADFAAQLFPGVPTTTAMNGAQSPDKADWSPLKGRDVWIWPDNDEPGQRYAERVAELAYKAGAVSVKVLSISLLAVDPVIGTPRELPKGWDAADAVVDGWTAERLAVMHKAGKLFNGVMPKQGKESKADKLPRFEVRADGVYYLGISFSKQAKSYEPDPPLWICSRLVVTAITRDTKGENWGRLLELLDLDGVTRSWAMPMTMLGGRFDLLFSELLRLGVRVSSDNKARRLLIDYFTQANPKKHAHCVLVTGWLNDFNTFVFPQRTIGDQTASVLYQADTLEANPYSEKSTLDAWQKNVSALCVGNSRLVFSVSCAFAAALLGPAEEDGGGFHFRGESSGGKTTLLRVAASAWGGPNYLLRWRATSNGLEAQCAIHSDTLLVLDELGQVEPREAGENSYMVSNGSGKDRSDRNGNARARKTWRVLFISAGEISLSEHMAQAGKKTHAGQEVRMADIPANAGKGLGAFEELHGRKDGHEFSRDLCEAVARDYGVAAPAFIESVIKLGGKLPEMVKRFRDEFMQSLPNDAGGQARRAGSRFALVAAAGEIATACGITGWSAGEADRAAHVCFKAWLDGRGGAGNAEVTALLRQVRQFFEIHGEARFSPWERAMDDHAPRTSNRAGFVRRDVTADTLTYFVLPEVFRNEICSGFDYRDAQKILLEHGWLKPEPPTEKQPKERPTRKERLPGYGKPTRCYVIPLSDVRDSNERDIVQEYDTKNLVEEDQPY